VLPSDVGQKNFLTPTLLVEGVLGLHPSVNVDGDLLLEGQGNGFDLAVTSPDAVSAHFTAVVVEGCCLEITCHELFECGWVFSDVFDSSSTDFALLALISQDLKGAGAE